MPKLYADSRAIIGLVGQPPVFGRLRRPRLSLAQLTSVRPGIRGFDQCLERHRIFREEVLANENVREVRVKNDLYSDNPESMGILFGLQHPPNELTSKGIRELFGAGIRFMGIAHEEYSAIYGDGLRGEGSLTQRGADLIRLFGEYGIILDLSHASHSTVTGALTIIVREGLPTKVMASHSGCHPVHHHAGNLTGQMILQLRRMNGYIGIPARTYLIAEKGDRYLERFVEHVDYAIRVCRDSTIIGIGSDCNHLDMTQEQARLYFRKMVKPKGSEDCGEYSPDRPGEIIEQGSNMFRFFEERLLKKYPQAVVDGVCGRNFNQFLFRSLP